MERILVLLTMFLVGCGAVDRGIGGVVNRVIPDQHTHIDAELAPYVRTVMAWSGETLSETIDYIRIVDRFESPSTKDAIGVCTTPPVKVWLPGTRHIKIYDGEFYTSDKGIDIIPWRGLDENSRLMLIAHELGHCQWNVNGHDDSGLMQPMLFDGDAFEAFSVFYSNLRVVENGRTR